MKSAFNNKVSWFLNYNSPIPQGVVEIGALLQSTKHKAAIERIRLIADKSERDALKATLPAFTPSCVCTYRSKSKVVEHSGLLQFDIDAKDNPNIVMADARSELQGVPNIAYCGLSVSGKGLWGLIPIAYPQKHKQHFEYVRRCFEGWGFIIDKAPCSVVSLRGLSYDENAYYNPYAETVTQYYENAPKDYNSQFCANGEMPVWQQYNLTDDFENVLKAHNWVVAAKHGDKTRYTRPGKGGGVSAEYDKDKGIFYVFTSSTEFEANKGYPPFAVFAMLEHGGDFKQATIALLKQN